MMRTLSRPGISLPRLRGLEHAGDDRRSSTHVGDTVVTHPTQDLGPVDLADHDLLRSHPGGCEGVSPAVGVEHRQRVQEYVAVGQGDVQAEGDRVDPDVAVRDLHALGARGRARGVVDAGSRVLVRLPGPGRDTLVGEEVLVVAQHETVFRGHGRQCLVDLGVDVQHAGAGVLHDVGHLVRAQPEVDRNQHAPIARDAVEGRQQPSTVVGDDCDALTLADAELVEPGCHPGGERMHLVIGELPSDSAGWSGSSTTPMRSP